MSEKQSVVSIEELNSFFENVFGSQGNNRGRKAPATTHVEYGRVLVEMPCNENMLRPGGFIAGPVQMALADHAAYVAIFTQTGIVPMALTSNLNIDFLRPCQGDNVTADARVVKLGKTLAVINVEIRGSSSDKLSSQAVVTYALPKE